MEGVEPAADVSVDLDDGSETDRAEEATANDDQSSLGDF
jgi:helicase